MRHLHQLVDNYRYLEDRLMVIGAKDAEIQTHKFEISALKGELEANQRTIHELKRQASLEQEARKRREDEASNLRGEETELKVLL